MGVLTFDYIFTSINLLICLYIAGLTAKYYTVNKNKKFVSLLVGFSLLTVGYGIKILANVLSVSALVAAFNTLILVGTYAIIATYYKSNWKIHIPVIGFSIATAILSVSDVILAHVVMGNFILFLVAILEQEKKNHRRQSQAKLMITSFTVIGIGKGIALLALITLPLVIASWGLVSVGYILLIVALIKAQNEAKKKQN